MSGGNAGTVKAACQLMIQFVVVRWYRSACNPAGFNIRCMTFANKMKPQYSWFFLSALGIHSIKELFTMRASTSPCSPAERFPTDQHHINVDSKPQSAGKVNCDRIAYENSILNFPPEEKSSLKPSNDPGCEMQGGMLSGNQTKPGSWKALAVWTESGD